LFASNVAWSRNGQTAGRVQQPSRDLDETPSRLPSTDEVVQSVVKAMTAQDAPGTATPQPAQNPAAVPVNAPQVESAKPEAGLHTVFEGTWLSGVLTNRLNGSAVGPVNVLISEPLYAADGVLVAPAGSRLLGAASPVRDFGQNRLAVSFHRLLLPDGASRSLDQFKGLSQVGEVGLKDKVNNHYLSTFGAAALIGLIQGLSQYIGSGGARGDGDDVYVVTGSVTDSTSQQTAQVMSRFLNRPPEIEIREGVRVRAYVSSDLTFPAYGAAK
jgi:type IV secretion system protein VirB10